MNKAKIDSLNKHNFQIKDPEKRRRGDSLKEIKKLGGGEEFYRNKRDTSHAIFSSISTVSLCVCSKSKLWEIGTLKLGILATKYAEIENIKLILFKNI